MAINKVIYQGNTLIDLTNDTVTPEALAEGVTAHSKSGEVITGTATGGAGGSGNLIEGTFTANGTYEADPVGGIKTYIDNLNSFEASGLGYIKKSENFTIEDKENILANLEIYFPIPEELVSQVGTDKEIIATGPDFTLNEEGIPSIIAEVYTCEDIDLMFIFIKDADIFNAELSTNFVNGDMLYIVTDQNFLDQLTQMGEQGISLESALEKEAQPFDGWNKITINIPAPPNGNLDWQNSQGIFYAFSENNENLYIYAPNYFPDYSITGYADSTIIPPWAGMTFINCIVYGKCSQLGKYAFYNTTIHTLTLSSSIESFARGALWDSNIKRVFITNPNFNFQYFTECREIIYNGTLEDWCNSEVVYSNAPILNYDYLLLNDGVPVLIDIPETVSVIKPHCFHDFPTLKEVYFHNGVVEIGASAFDSCDQLTYCELNEGLTTIRQWAFSDCKNLTQITVPSTVTVIENGAFILGSDQNKVTYKFNSTTPVALTRDPFRYPTYINKIIVPQGCGDAYKTASIWSNYASYIEEATE